MVKPSGKLSSIMFLLALAGIAVSVYLVYYHEQLAAGSEGWCDFSKEFSCDAVLLSEYSEVAGVPLGVLGAGWFLILLVMHYVGAKTGSKRLAETMPFYVLVWSLVGIGSVAYLFYIETFILGAYCVLCTAAHIITVAVLVVAAMSLKRPVKYYVNKIFYE